MSLRNKENLKWFIVFVKLSSLRNVFYGTVSQCIKVYRFLATTRKDDMNRNFTLN